MRRPETHIGDDPLHLYLEDVGKYPLLTKEQEVELAKQIEIGQEARKVAEESGVNAELEHLMEEGNNARNLFILSNLRLVVSIAKKYPETANLTFLDLIQEGNIGMEHAVDKFDWRMGYKFSTYATWWIRQAISRAIDQKGTTIRIPVNLGSEYRSYWRNADITDESELPEHLVATHKMVHPMSLDRQLLDDGDSDLHDVISSDIVDPSEAAEDQDSQQIKDRVVVDILESLEPRKRLAVELYFGIMDGRKRSYREVGEVLNITGEAARRLVIRACQLIKAEKHQYPELLDII